MTHCRRVLISIFIMAAVFALISPFAFADMDPETFGHWMSVALKASDIAVQSTSPIVDPIVDFVVNPFDITEDLIFQPINYTFPRINLTTPGQDLESYLRRSSIKVRGETITIDGIDYQDIWVTNDAAQAFRTNVLDLQTAFNIASNSSGKFVSGVGTWRGIPFFKVGDSYRSQLYLLPSGTSSVGSNSFNVWASGGSSYTNVVCYYNGKQEWNLYSLSGSLPATVWYYSLTPGNSLKYARISNSSRDPYSSYIERTQSGDGAVSEPFDFTWVSQVVPAETLDPEDGLHLFVPNNPDQFSDTHVQDNIRQFNLNLNNNFSFDTPIDLSSENNYTLFDSLFGDISLNIDLTKDSYGPYSSPTPIPSPSPSFDPVPWPTIPPTPDPSPTPEPTPTTDPSPTPAPTPTSEPTPVPSSPIGETPFTYLNDGLDGLKDTLQQGFHNLVDSFATGEADFFSDIVDLLSTVFQSLLDKLKAVTHIWAYVTAWVGNVSAPFNFMLSALGSAGSYFLSPFSAIAACCVVIAIYKRFGR